MTTNFEILEAANKHYPDGALGHYYDGDGTLDPDIEAGDGLAKFIAVELSEASEGDVQVAISLLSRAELDIQFAMQGLLELRQKLNQGKPGWEEE